MNDDNGRGDVSAYQRDACEGSRIKTLVAERGYNLLHVDTNH